jgi:glycosyltransferase involved in cell wall biosynthesis
MSSEFRSDPPFVETRAGEREPEQWAQSEPGIVARLSDELLIKDREIQDLRKQLRAIHTSDAWAAIRTLSQIRNALAPPATRRDQLFRLGIKALRRIKKATVQRTGYGRTISRSRSENTAVHSPSLAAAETRYAVICLPVIEWHFRFQRPQQLMRQFAKANHLVLYAANRFHRSADARTRSIESNILEMSLPGDPTVNMYQNHPAPADVGKMVEAIARLRRAINFSDAIVIAQHPFWTAVAEALRARYGWPLVYDCMDDHSGFLNNTHEILELERRLVATADLVVTSSERLFSKMRRDALRARLIRNGCDYEHFKHSHVRGQSSSDHLLIGYYGAIAEWFDAELVAELARARPAWRFELIGSTLAGAVGSFAELANVRLLGERPYADLPRLIRDWDLCIIPFKRVALTEATNPVKVYEMLATGKPVVASRLPELVPIAREGLIRVADTATQFAHAIESETREKSPDVVEGRRAFARLNTWHARYVELASAIDEILHERGMECTPRHESADLALEHAS